jgi:glucose/arabinose dehydrogenase
MMMMAVILIGAGAAPAQEIALDLFLSGLDNPVAITHAGDGTGRLFITLQGGLILVHDGAGLRDEPFLDIRTLVSCCGEQGLLSVAFHPRHAENGVFYVNYTDDTGATVVARYTVFPGDPDRADPGSAAVLLTVPQPFTNHNGGQLQFGPDGYLYIGMGDGGSGGDPLDNAQRLTTLLGKMLRIDVDGGVPYAIPPDNPFRGSPPARPEIWASGLRNPWRFGFDRATGDLFIGDVGQGAWEEIDYQPAGSPGGENYGWRLMEGAHCFNPSSGCNPGTLTLPILEYGHALGCSVTGGYRYRGAGIPAIQGQYLFSDWCSGRIWGASPDGGGTWRARELLASGRNVVAFGEDGAGELYLAHRPVGGPGAIYRIVAGGHPAPVVDALAPPSAIARDPGLDLSVSGEGFVPFSVVRVNGSARPTTFVSSRALVARLRAADLARAGTLVITVFTPAPGGGLSAGRALAINPTFLDVAPGDFAAVFIERLAASGVTAGCGGRQFCPDASVTRGQVAALLLRALAWPGQPSPPAPTGTVYGDVPVSHPFAAWIEALAAAGITGGCGAGNYCPALAATRGQIAVLLLKARYGPAHRPLPPTGRFTDVPVAHPLAAWIEQFAAEGLTAGCGGGRFCPDAPVTRAQLAVFLVRSFL